MGRLLRPLKPKEVVTALTKLGFLKRRQTGSHLIFKNNKLGRMVVVPIHQNQDIKTGTLRSIIRQSGVSVEEFFTFLK